MDEKTILANLEDLTADILFTEWKAGNIEYEKAENTGRLEYNKGKSWKEKIDKFYEDDDAAWDEAQYSDESALRNYIAQYKPRGRHIEEAKKAIDSLKEKEREREQAREDILDKLRQNLLSVTEIQNHLKNNTLRKSDIQELDIPDEVKQLCINYKSIDLKLGKTPESIPEGFTEVYLWGIPGSGKTCALSAILGTAERMGLLALGSGEGRGYAMKLKNIFDVDEDSNYAILPPPTPLEKTQYLPFTLRKKNESDARSVSLIELSGEIFKCFTFLANNSDSDQQLPSQIEDTFNTLTNYLQSKNRKIHFFFIDYDKGNKVDEDGIRQSDYLDAARLYFEENHIFDRTTDAIYIVLTKSDLLRCLPENLLNETRNYMTNRFDSFINTMRNICQRNVAGGQLYFEPFSIGEVFYKGICKFDESASKRIIEILMNRIQPAKKNLLEFLNK